LGSRGMHERLKALDPVSAERIDPHNPRRNAGRGSLSY